MHAILYLSLPVGTFSATMICLYLAALDPDAVHRVLDRSAHSVDGFDRTAGSDDGYCVCATH